MKNEWSDGDQGIAPEQKEVELVDLVDASGTIIKQGVLRSEADLYPDLHLQIVIGVIFDKEGRILVHKRAQTKIVNPGDIDHVCGGIKSGEQPQEAVLREAGEETRTTPQNLSIVLRGVNRYNRYRYLFAGETNDEPGPADPEEVEWIRFIHPDELKEKFNSREFTFVDDFFDDIELALAHKTASHPQNRS